MCESQERKRKPQVSFQPCPLLVGGWSGHARQLPRDERGHRWPSEVLAPNPHTPSTDGSMCPCESVVLDMATPWGYGRGLGTGVWGRCGGGVGEGTGAGAGLSPGAVTARSCQTCSVIHHPLGDLTGEAKAALQLLLATSRGKTLASPRRFGVFHCVSWDGFTSFAQGKTGRSQIRRLREGSESAAWRDGDAPRLSWGRVLETTPSGRGR